jgi:hypothetical protein
VSGGGVPPELPGASVSVTGRTVAAPAAPGAGT